MPWSIFNETFRRNWRGMIFWGLGLGLLGAVMTMIIPNMALLKQLESLMKMLPAIAKSFGMDDAAQMATPEGVIGAGYFGRVLLLLAVYTVLSGLNITVNEEDQGIMDMLLSLPVARWRIVLEKFAAYTLMILVIVTIGFFGLYLGSVAAAIQVDTQKLIISSINIVPSALLMLAFTTFAGSLFRHKNHATAITVLFIVGSYVMDFVGNAASDSPIAGLRSISFFAYYDNVHVMQNGMNVGSIMLLLGITVILLIASIWCFQQRDVGI
jgi:ABC-2 type transport system permease protein